MRSVSGDVGDHAFVGSIARHDPRLTRLTRVLSAAANSNGHLVSSDTAIVLPMIRMRSSFLVSVYDTERRYKASRKRQLCSFHQNPLTPMMGFCHKVSKTIDSTSKFFL